MLAFEDNCFCFQVTAFFTKKVKFIQNLYKECPLFDKRTYNWKTKAMPSKANVFFSFVDIIILTLLASFFDTWFHFLKQTKKKTRNYPKKQTNKKARNYQQKKNKTKQNKKTKKKKKELSKRKKRISPKT